MSDLILREFNGKKIRQRKDGFMSATDMCEAHGKLFGNWNQLKATKEYLEALRGSRYWNSNNGPVEIFQGGEPSTQGTWVDRRVAMRLAQWLSPEFAIQVDEWVVELMERGTVSIADSVQPPEPLFVLRPAIERVEALHKSLTFFGIDPENPRFKQGLQDLVGDTLGLGSQAALPESDEKWCGVAERAEQLGIPVTLVVKHRSQLGKRIKAVIPEEDRREEDRLCNGSQRPINLYRITPDLDGAIQSYFATATIKTKEAA